MCRSIRTLHNFAPPATEAEAGAAALQYVRKISGFTRPSRANAAAFDEAVQEVTQVTRRLLDRLVSAGPPRSREREAENARERGRRRAARPAGDPG